MICLEKLENTLDYLMETRKENLSTREWKSCLFQVIMILLCYQKVFDLHIMICIQIILWVKTDKNLFAITQ